MGELSLLKVTGYFVVIILLSRISFKQSLIIKKLHKMSTELDGIKQDLADSTALVQKVKADVELLHAKIDALGDAPTPAEIAEVKQMSADLKDSLSAVDDLTPEEDTPPTV
jgi:hypothetical protein